MKGKTKLTIAIITICIAALYTSVNISDSNSTLLVKNNIEAISQSYGNDPGNAITPEICYFSVKKMQGSNVYKCNMYSTYFYSTETVEDADKREFIEILPCETKQNRISKEKSNWGYCWHQ